MKQYILKHPDGTIYGPVPESKFEEDLKENRLKEGTLVYFIDKVQMIKEKHWKTIKELVTSEVKRAGYTDEQVSFL